MPFGSFLFTCIIGCSALAITFVVGSPHSRVHPTFAVRATPSATDVPAIPPDTIPLWFGDDSSYTLPGGGLLKRVLSVRFGATTTRAQRQAAIDAFGGRVVGGVRLLGNWGYYYVYRAGDTTLAQIEAAEVAMAGQPGVEFANGVPRVGRD